MKISELPEAIRLKALEYQIIHNKANNIQDKTDNLRSAFIFDRTTEGAKYWINWNDKKTEPTTQSHYDNTNGSLYKFCEDKDLNSYEFDLIKRIMRCRKKGNFIEDLEKTKFLIDLYLKEFETTTKPNP